MSSIILRAKTINRSYPNFVPDRCKIVYLYSDGYCVGFNANLNPCWTAGTTPEMKKLYAWFRKHQQ